MDSPLVNIMMPVYNGMPMIKASIESIRRQTYQNWECIICDDGSTDGTGEFLKTLSDSPLKGESKFVVLTNSHNMGRGFSRQRILDQCKGKYICMLDAGDLMHPERIERQVRFLEEHPEIGLVSSGMLSFGLDTDIRTTRRGDGKYYTFNGTYFPAHAASMFRNPKMIEGKSDIQLTYDQREGRSEDVQVLVQFFKLYPKFYMMADYLYYYDEFNDYSRFSLSLSYLRDSMMHLSDAAGDMFCHREFFVKELKLSALCLLKFVYSMVVYPFIPKYEILAKRGKRATAEQIEEFDRYAAPLIDKYKNVI